LIDYIYVPFYQEIDGPGVLGFYSFVAYAEFVDHAVYVGAAGHEDGGHCASYQYAVGVDGLPFAVELVFEVLVPKYGPGFFEGDELHAVEDTVGYFWSSVGEAIAFPFRRQGRELIAGDLLAPQGNVE
jgi:hypothetical protein